MLCSASSLPSMRPLFHLSPTSLISQSARVAQNKESQRIIADLQCKVGGKNKGKSKGAAAAVEPLTTLRIEVG